MSEVEQEMPGVLERELAPEAGMPSPTLDDREPSGVAKWTLSRVAWILVGLVFLAWAVWAFVDNGTTFVALTGAGIAEGAIVTLAALGFVMMYKATGIANFAQGDLITLGAFLGFWATDQTGVAANGLSLTLGFGFIVALVVMFFVGVAIERVAYAPLRGRSIHVVVIATLGVALIIRTILAIWQGSDPRFLRSWFNPGENLQNFGVFSGGVLRINSELLGIHDAVIAAQRVLIVVVTALVIVAMIVMFNYTSFGRQLRAIAADRETARLYGVPASRLSMLSFGISAVLAGLAGLMIGPLGSFDLTVGFTYMLLAFAAVTLGGFTSLPGIVVGGLLIGLVEQVFGGQMLPMVAGDTVLKYGSAFPYVLMLVVIAVRPQGLFSSVGGRL